MAKNWEELSGERGQTVATGRLERALKLGGLTAKVTGSALAHTLRKRFGGGDADATTRAVLDNAERIVKVMGEMKGAAMKVGQLLSADPDLVAPEFADHLSKLQKSAPPMTFEQVQRQITTSFDRPLHELYRTFESEPLGAASIGQVHRATLFDGREVAVKIQYPGIADTLDSDLKNLASVLSVGRIIVDRARLDGFIEEARSAILNEADYALEARTLLRFRSMLRGRPGIKVPDPVFELTGRHVLTMEYCKGEKLDVALNALPDQEQRDAIVTRFVETFVWMFHDRHVIHADPHPGNFLLDDEGNVVLLDFGCTRDFDPELCDGLLRLLRSFWADDIPLMEQNFRDMGFGTAGGKFPDHEVMRAYHRLILEPIRYDAPFSFADWSVHGRIRGFLRENMVMIRMPPPPGLLLYIRVLAGLKGQMTRMKANINLRRIAEEACARRGIV